MGRHQPVFSREDKAKGLKDYVDDYRESRSKFHYDPETGIAKEGKGRAKPMKKGALLGSKKATGNFDEDTLISIITTAFFCCTGVQLSLFVQL